MSTVRLTPEEEDRRVHILEQISPVAGELAKLRLSIETFTNELKEVRYVLMALTPRNQ